MMSERAKAFWTIYKMGRVTEEDLRDAVDKRLLTEEEFAIITGE